MATWWTQLDWAFTLNFVPAGFLPPTFIRLTLQQLLALPVGSESLFKPFADQLITGTGLVWPIQDQESGRDILRGIVEHAVMDPLREFGVPAARYEPSRILGLPYRDLTGFQITSFGRGLLQAVGQATGQNRVWVDISIANGGSLTVLMKEQLHLPH